MSQPVNLNRFRKNKARAEQKARAAENAVNFGRTKTAKKADKDSVEKAIRHIDDHKRDDT